MHGKTARGKLSPANPHLTNPVPLSHTTTLFLDVIVGEESAE